MRPRNEDQDTLTRADLREAIYTRCSGLSRQQSRELLDMVLEEIINALVQGESLRLRTFGTFEVRCKRERLGRNPMTGVEAPISARRVISFLASPVLVAKINGATPDVEEPDETDAMDRRQAASAIS